MLDQIGLLDDFLQVGFIGRTSNNYDHAGTRVNQRGWQRVFLQTRGAYLDYYINIRLNYIEDLLRESYEKQGGRLIIGWEIISLTMGRIGNDSYKVNAGFRAVGNITSDTLKRYEDDNCVGTVSH
jgi:hypothetical protein